MLSGKELKRFDDFHYVFAQGRSDLALNDVHDHDKLLNMMIDLFLSGSRFSDLNVDLVRAWAAERGWSEADARELGTICDTIYETLRITGQISIR